MEVEFVGGGKAEITVDSGAEESVCRVGWGKEFGMQQVAEKMRLVNAGGGKIEHYGNRRVAFTAPGF